MTVKLNLARLKSIQHSMEAIENLQELIEYYESGGEGSVASLTVNRISYDVAIQLERKFMIEALVSQMNELILSLETRYGFEYDPDADWAGDDE